MTSPNLSPDIIEMLLTKGYLEAPSDNKQWRIFFRPEKMETRWFVHEGGKVRRGKSVHNSTAISQEARRMLGRYWREKEGKEVSATKSNFLTASLKTPRQKTTASSSAAGTIRAMLKRPDGATIDDLANATGWKPHSLRAFLSRLRKTAVVRSQTIGSSTYYSVKRLSRPKTHQD